jgi:hypothetical protein
MTGLIERVAAAIANARGARRGMPRITNILAVVGTATRAELIEDARAVLEEIREPTEQQVLTGRGALIQGDAADDVWRNMVEIELVLGKAVR